MVYLLVVLLVGCHSSHFPSEENVTLKEVENAISQQGFRLEKADLPSDNVFRLELNDVSPAVHRLKGSTLSIYIFESIIAREEGIEDFEEKTATAEVVRHERFKIGNALVFYAEGEEDTAKKLEDVFDKLGGTS